MCVENKDNVVMYLKAILKSTGAGSTSGRDDQFFLKCENFRKYFNCPSTSIITSTFASNHCLTLMCVFSICFLEWTEESDDEDFASENTRSFLKIRRNCFKNPTTLLRRYNPSAMDTRNLNMWRFSSCPLDILHIFCNTGGRYCPPPIIRSLEEVETSVMYIPAQSTKPFKLFFSLIFTEQWLLNAFVYLASHIFTSLLRKR